VTRLRPRAFSRHRPHAVAVSCWRQPAGIPYWWHEHLSRRQRSRRIIQRPRRNYGLAPWPIYRLQKQGWRWSMDCWTREATWPATVPR